MELQIELQNYMQNCRTIELPTYSPAELQNYTDIEIYRAIELYRYGTIELQNHRTIGSASNYFRGRRSAALPPTALVSWAYPRCRSESATSHSRHLPPFGAGTPKRQRSWKQRHFHHHRWHGCPEQCTLRGGGYVLHRCGLLRMGQPRMGATSWGSRSVHLQIGLMTAELQRCRTL